MTQTLYVVSHTHWDREWYLTYQQFRMRLVDLLDNLLDLMDRDPEYRYFSLDAQTITLQDYLAVKPQNRARLEGYIREGRITIGPWYQLNDEFLTSGESTVRSLLIGHRIAQEFGVCQKIGYLPDQFGNLSQMPQIFRGFGIDNAIVGRGYQVVGDRKMEFLWESPDGSQVTASLMAFWYNNAQTFPADPEAALRYTLGIRDRMAPLSTVSSLLLMNGVDHLEAQQNLSPILKGLQASLPKETQIVHATLPHYMDALKREIAEKNLALQVHEGELREDRNGSCLAGTLSTRMYLKQANQRSQTLLERYAEPFASFAMLSGVPYPQDFLRYAWKLLMENHPHDSICGCSVDQVHREMMPRFEQTDQIGEEIVRRSLKAVADTVSTDSEGEHIVVFNSLNWERTDPVTAKIEFPLGIPTRGAPPRDDNKQVKGFTLHEESGAEVPFLVRKIETKMKAVLSPVELPLDQWVQEIEIEFIATDIPACGYRAYQVRPCDAMPVFAPLTIEDMPAQWYADPFFLCDCGEVGDEYLHRKPLRDRLYTLNSLFSSDKSHSVERTALGIRARNRLAISLPSCASADGQSRSEEETECPIMLEQTIWKGVPRSEYRITFQNNVKDHMLFAEFMLGQEAPTLVTEGQYDAIERSVIPPLVEEGALSFYPQQAWVASTATWRDEEGEESQQTLAIANRGLPALEVGEDIGGNAVVRLILLRCMQYLSRRGDGPQFETPEAQCPGEHSFEFAFYFSEGDWKESKVWKQAHQYTAPLRAVQTSVRAGDTRLAPSSRSLVSISSDSFVLTALKRAEDSPNTLIVRGFNTTDAPLENVVLSVLGARSATRTNLNEEPQESLPLQGEAVTLPQIRPKQIVTLAFELSD